MKKLAYLCGEYPRATDTFIQREVASLRTEGFIVDTISVRKPSDRERGTQEQESERKNTYYLLPCSLLKLLSTHIKLIIRFPLSYFSALKLAVSVRSPGLKSLIYQLFYFAEAGLVVDRLNKNNITHIHNHAPDACGYVSMLAARLGKLTYSMTLHGFAIFSESGRWRLKEKIENSLFTICISMHGISQAMLWSDSTNWDKLKLVHCGIDSDNTKKVRKHQGVGKNILFVGRIDHVKGLPNLIKAFGLLVSMDMDIHLHIVGDGPERDSVEKQILDAGLVEYVSMYGYKSQQELKAIYSDSDIFVMTSFFEGIPVVLMEAMSYGVPVIAPRITGVPELVHDGKNGILTTPGDYKELSIAIKTLLLDSEKRTIFGVEGQKTVEKHFNLKTEAKRLTKIMNEYLE